MAAVGTAGSTGGGSAAVMRWMLRSALERLADATGLLEAHRDETIAVPVKALAQLAPWHAVRGPGGQDPFYATGNINGT
jgi:hypothetical protein